MSFRSEKIVPKEAFVTSNTFLVIFFEMFFGVDGCIDCQNAKRENVSLLTFLDISRYTG